jgi:hypothetical protein
MESEHRRFCERWIEGMRQRIEVWEIEDVGPISAVEIANKVERTFAVIRHRIDTLLTALGPVTDESGAGVLSASHWATTPKQLS